MKNIFAILVFYLCSSTLIAQNAQLAKSYYSDASRLLQKEYYEAALEKILKCKEASGATNADILYVELTARYHVDMNINKTKSLVNAFMEQSFAGDERRKEVDKIKSAVFYSDEFYSNGQRKQGTYRDENDDPVDISFNLHGRKTKQKKYVSETKVTITEYYFYNNDILSFRLIDNWHDDNYFRRSSVVYCYDKKGSLIQEYSPRKDEMEAIGFSFFYPSGKELYADKTGRIEEYHSLYRINSRDRLDGVKIGIIKKAFYPRGSGPCEVIYFDEEGIPTIMQEYKKWDHFKKQRKPKRIYRFNPQTEQWTEV